MGTEEEIAEALIGVRSAEFPGMVILGDNEGDRADARALAAALAPLLNRVRAEALREAARFLRSSDNPQRSSEFRRESYVMDDAGYQLFVRADAIEQNSEGNET